MIREKRYENTHHLICITKISDISLNYLLAAKLSVKKMVDLIVVKHNLNITFLYHIKNLSHIRMQL